MSYPEGYGTPAPERPIVDPSQVISQTPPLQRQEDSSEFKVYLTQPPKVEAGTTARIYFHATHIKDGLIGISTRPYVSGPTLMMLDGTGQPWTGAGVSAITVNPVTADPSGGGLYYSSVQIGPSVPPGDYEAQWNATYTPIGTTLILPIRGRKALKIGSTKAPSKYYFKATSQY